MSVSVVIPSFNSGRFLERALESAFAQDPAPVEVIIQDAGSTDGTAELVAGLGDQRIRFVSEPDDGQSDALNRAISRASGEWIAWLNADDLLRPGLFASADGDADLIYGDFDYVDEHDHTVGHVTPHSELSVARLLTHGCYVFSGAALFRRSIFDRFGGLETDLRYTMDYELYLRIAPHIRVRYVPRTLGAFRVHSDSLTTDISWGLFRETARVRRRYGGYGRETRVPVLVNQAKQIVDAATVPLRRRFR